MCHVPEAYICCSKHITAGVQPRLIQGIRSGDGVGDLFNYLFIKNIKSNRIRIALSEEIQWRKAAEIRIAQ